MKDKKIMALKAKPNILLIKHVNSTTLIESNEENEKVIAKKVDLQKNILELQNDVTQLNSQMEGSVIRTKRGEIKTWC